jgi:hypothetical protein
VQHPLSAPLLLVRFAIKQPLNHALEFLIFMEGFVLKQIYQSKFVKVINKTHIIIIVTDRCTSRAQTSEKISSKGTLDLLVDTGYGNW